MFVNITPPKAFFCPSLWWWGIPTATRPAEDTVYKTTTIKK